MASNASLAHSMKELGISVRGTNITFDASKIENWVWHHSNKSGVMKSVPQVQHTNGSIFWNTLHLGNVGGICQFGEEDI